jgi:hypothetical protein
MSYSGRRFLRPSPIPPAQAAPLPESRRKGQRLAQNRPHKSHPMTFRRLPWGEGRSETIRGIVSAPNQTCRKSATNSGLVRPAHHHPHHCRAEGESSSQGAVETGLFQRSVSSPNGARCSRPPFVPMSFRGADCCNGQDGTDHGIARPGERLLWINMSMAPSPGSIPGLFTL